MLVILLLFMTGRADDTAVFHKFLADHAEKTAVDCGITRVGDDPGPGFACASKAQQTGQGFFLQIQQQGIDSHVADGWAATHNGDIFYFRYDSDPSGGNRAGAVVYQHTCVNPTLDSLQINCDDFESTIRIPLK